MNEKYEIEFSLQANKFLSPVPERSISASHTRWSGLFKKLSLSKRPFIKNRIKKFIIRFFFIPVDISTSTN
jgi:hypothetical protein